jgi:hypothetical protein
MRPLILAAAFALAGCSTQLQSDLGKAEAPCHRDKPATKLALARCLDVAEAPVWARDEPQTLDLYREFAGGRAAIAKERDAGTITEKDYDTKLGALAQDMRARIAERRELSAE